MALERTAPVPASTHRVRVADDVTLHAEVAGDGPPLLLIQGLGYATWAWQRQVPALAGLATTIAFDNRGSGRSDKPDAPYSIGLLADDALAVLSELGPAPADVAGFSMGGYVALTLAHRYPDAVRSLTLLATTCGGEGALGVPEETKAAWRRASSLDPAAFARETMPLSFAPGWADEHPDELERWLVARLAHPTPPFAWRRQYAACEAFLEHGIAAEKIAQRALVVHGTADRVVPYANAGLLAARLPECRLVRLDGAGHLALLERPDDVNTAIARHLAA
jgi:3-oxoadipate enol-lactonase